MTKLTNVLKGALAATVAMSAMSSVAVADTMTYGDVTPNIIMGDGIPNGNFTIATGTTTVGDDSQEVSVEIGLLAKDRTTYLINGDGSGTYTYGVDTNPWSIDWSIYTANGTIGTFTYLLEVDSDPSLSTSILAWDVVNSVNPYGGCFDHQFGTLDTAPSAGVSNTDCTGYATLLDTSSVLQQSWQYQWTGASFDYGVDGTYDISLSAFNGEHRVATSSIQVIIGNGGVAVPEPASMALFGLGLLGFGVTRRSKVK